MWPIQLEKIPRKREMIETVLMCFNEIGLPEELEKLITNFFAISFKILYKTDLNTGPQKNIGTGIL